MEHGYSWEAGEGMAATPQERAEFGKRLRALRRDAGISQAEAAGQLAKYDGENVTPAAMSEYERGVSAPSRQNVRALEAMFSEPDGALAGVLGYRADDGNLLTEVRSLREEVAALRALIERLDRYQDDAQGAGEAR